MFPSLTPHTHATYQYTFLLLRYSLPSANLIYTDRPPPQAVEVSSCIFHSFLPRLARRQDTLLSRNNLIAAKYAYATCAREGEGEEDICNGMGVAHLIYQ